jgi:hypothetical protein
VLRRWRRVTAACCSALLLVLGCLDGLPVALLLLLLLARAPAASRSASVQGLTTAVGEQRRFPASLEQPSPAAAASII